MSIQFLNALIAAVGECSRCRCDILAKKSPDWHLDSFENGLRSKRIIALSISKMQVCAILFVNAVILTILAILNPHHTAAYMVICVIGAIGPSLFVAKNRKFKINVHLNSSLWGIAQEHDEAIPTDFMLVFPRMTGRNGFDADRFIAAIHSLRGRAFPLSLNISGLKITVVVDVCENGVPSYLRSVGIRDVRSEIDITANSRSGFIDTKIELPLSNSELAASCFELSSLDSNTPKRDKKAQPS